MPDGTRAEFIDVGWGVPDDVPQGVLEEISQRTPGFIGRQQEHWLYRADATAFLGRVGREEARHLPKHSPPCGPTWPNRASMQPLPTNK